MKLIIILTCLVFFAFGCGSEPKKMDGESPPEIHSCSATLQPGFGVSAYCLGCTLDKIRKESQFDIESTFSPVQKKAGDVYWLFHNVYEEITAVRIILSNLDNDCIEHGSLRISSHTDFNNLERMFSDCVPPREPRTGCMYLICEDGTIEIRKCIGNINEIVLYPSASTAFVDAGSARMKTDLMYLVEIDDMPKIELMLRANNDNRTEVTRVDEFGQDLLMKVILADGPIIAENRLALVRRLISYGSNLFIRDMKGELPLEMARARGQAEVEKLLIEEMEKQGQQQMVLPPGK